MQQTHSDLGAHARTFRSPPGLLESGLKLANIGEEVRCTTYESNVLFTLRFMVDCKVGGWVGGYAVVRGCRRVGGLRHGLYQSWGTKPLYAERHDGLRRKGPCTRRAAVWVSLLLVWGGDRGYTATIPCILRCVVDYVKRGCTLFGGHLRMGTRER